MDAEDTNEGMMLDETKAAQKVGPYPLDALPQLVRDVVDPYCSMTGLPPEAIASLLMGACAGACGNLAVINMENAWTEACVTWTALVAPSGSMKSAAIRCAQHVLQDVERESGAGAEGSKGGVLVVTGDPTTEAIAMYEMANPLGLAICRDELAGIIAGRDAHRQGKGVDSAFYLQAYDGEPYQQLRKQSESARIPHHALTFIGCIQPGVLGGGVFGQADFLSGFLARWQFVRIPRREPGTHPSADSGAAQEYAQAHGALVDRLVALRGIGMNGASPWTVRCSPSARRGLRLFKDEQDRRAWPLPDGLRRSMLNKSGGLAARLALVIALIESRRMGSGAEDITVPVTEERADRAARLAAWHAFENERVYAGVFPRPLPAEEQQRAVEMAEQLFAKQGPFTVRDFQRRHHIATSAEAERLLGLCKPSGWDTEAKPRGPKGGKPTMLWRPSQD
jgi:hypothetical protein